MKEFRKGDRVIVWDIMTKTNKEMTLEILFLKAVTFKKYAFIDPDVNRGLTEEQCKEFIEDLRGVYDIFAIPGDSDLCPHCCAALYCRVCEFGRKYGICRHFKSLYTSLTLDHESLSGGLNHNSIREIIGVNND